ncbi:MAG: hypothetical protein JWO25_1764 [Alphaproteobacteria bacterium]|nr:hypothetical protein [Alphaproteobacteria bacterium]
MDLGFLGRAEKRFASRDTAQPDFGMLLVALRAQASASPAVQALVQWKMRRPFAHPLAEILLSGPSWRQAVAVQGGCFSPLCARQVN